MGIVSVILSFAITSGTVAAALGAAMYHRGTMVYACLSLTVLFVKLSLGIQPTGLECVVHSAHATLARSIHTFQGKFQNQVNRSYPSTRTFVKEITISWN
jgi:hypothetical protein